MIARPTVDVDRLQNRLSPKQIFEDAACGKDGREIRGDAQTKVLPWTTSQLAVTEDTVRVVIMESQGPPASIDG